MPMNYTWKVKMMNELPDDVAQFLSNAGGTKANELKKKYGLTKPIPEWIKFKTYLHHDPDELQVPEIFARANIDLDEKDWDKYEQLFGTPFYEVCVESSFNTVTGEVVHLKFNGKVIGQ